MSIFEKWADRVYAEVDFGRSLATSLSGAIGLAIYLKTSDWVIAAFCSIIFFPIARVTATALHGSFVNGIGRRRKLDEAKRVFDVLSDGEVEVVSAFVKAGGCAMTWGQMDRSSVSTAAVESLIQREILTTSVTADGMRETFVLATEIFDEAIRRSKNTAIL